MSGTTPERRSVLVVEDEAPLSDEIRAALMRDGHEVRTESRVEGGLREALRGTADLLIVDRMLHGSDGLAIVETLRAKGIRTPVLIISGLGAVDERIRGLKGGGDDYLVKPFAMEELSARVEALLRRLDDVRVTRLRVKAIEMDLIEKTVRIDGAFVELLPREFKLLEYFLRRPGQVVTRAMLLTDVWNYRFVPETNVVDVHIGNLRRKIDSPGAASVIKNIRGAGFMLDADP